jgi:hypothetical protein
MAIVYTITYKKLFVRFIHSVTDNFSDYTYVYRYQTGLLNCSFCCYES